MILPRDFAAYRFGIDENNAYIIYHSVSTGSFIPTLTTTHPDGTTSRKFVMIPEIYFHFAYLLEQGGVELAQQLYNDRDFLQLMDCSNIFTPFIAEVQRYIDTDPKTSDDRCQLERIFRNL